MSGDHPVSPPPAAAAGDTASRTGTHSSGCDAFRPGYDAGMRTVVRPRLRLAPAIGLLAAVSIAVGGCAGPAGPPGVPVTAVPTAPSATTGGTATTRPSAVSSSTAASHAPTGSPVGTTQTAWGRILDAVPAEFPVFPGATRADPPPNGPASGTWATKAPVDEVASWYRDALLAAHFAKVDLGSPLEDGSRVIDAQGDNPECKAQLAVAPAGSLTMITVLLGAACASGS